MENKPQYNPEEEQDESKKQDEKKHGITPAELDAITGSATDNVRARTHVDDSLANTGINTSYEGPTSTSPAGTGYNSGQSATGSRITTHSDEERVAHKDEKNEDENESESEEKDIV